ncbi:TRAP-type mannitol/chloroaromatic compound transport system, small permease component [Thalassovita gelatinovora]|uniref:TRAP transporter small permease protein n=1 Tax=Thalassovita gelatinovora TaxID=53501 RepID=A0A0P1FH69_THAGE|nr:TRAP transporter small permease subunit [Thalassovita gelatinovora]QIZ81949.1 TRAP transporter small permease subunit [Thalassovita gelatinovora]CUH67344.1 TRAP-type mannitol/chloroaromatic compound transport system, small permease component [Thalassovita gelatinovora]SEP75872.1 TRAP-type mannitol/chloroaromatic compound transport system, small permease component [Thalassovita gelatinovora]
MPSISFILPHWVYWGTLIVFPIVAMIMARRTQTSGYSNPIAYMILISGGILGLHRLYLRNLWGLLYLPIFFAILFANAQGKVAREAESQAANEVNSAQRVIERLEPKLAAADGKIAKLRANLGEAEKGSFAEKRATLTLEKAEQSVIDDTARIEKARVGKKAAEPALAEAKDARANWADRSFYAFLIICAFMLVDAILLPGLVKRAEARSVKEDEAASGSLAAIEHEAEARLEQIEAEETKQDEDHISTGWTGVIDRFSYYSGEFVSYWMVIAVIAYYYEVVARYVFNSPTIWVHEGMYLMFGMQYLIAGSYAALTEAHVKVDVFYAEWSPLRKAVVDLLTSIFFFIFAGTLLATGWIFAMDATVVDEVSFSEWQIAYWPFKWAIVVGAVLLILQGISKLASDLNSVRNSLQGA